MAFAHGFFQITVRGGDHADIDLHITDAADAADFVFLQYAQEFGLQEGGEFADFIEENRAAVGRFEQALLHLLGVGEAPFSWPKSSLSISVSGMAAQLMGTKGFSGGSFRDG